MPRSDEPAAAPSAARLEWLSPTPRTAAAPRRAGPLLPHGLALLLTALAAAVVVLSPVLFQAGWPHNHEYLSPLTRMDVIARQWQLGHLIPVWSTSHQWTMGSPEPGLYHKAFLYVAAAFYLPFGDGKLALCLALIAFMLLAFLGTAAAVRAMLGRRDWLIESVAGALVLSCNYAATDWLVRGAFAEFAAMAFAAWVFAWCAELLVRGRWRVWLGPVMAGLALSHVAIGLFSLVPLGLAVGMAAVRWRARWRAWVAPGLASLGLFAVLAAPFFLPMAALSGFNRMDALSVRGFTPQTHRVPMRRFFWDTDWSWGRSWEGYTVQIDLALLAATLLLAAALLALALVRRRTGGAEAADRDRMLCAGFLVATALVMLFLQSKGAIPVWNHVPGTALIQFAWRLLTFISIALALCAALLLDASQRLAGGPSTGGRVLAVLLGVGLLASTANNKPWASGASYAWFTPAEMQRALRLDYMGGGEYLPRTPAPTVAAAVAEFETLRQRGSPPCTLAALDDASVERARARFQVSCPAPGRVALPVFQVIGMAAEAGGASVAANPPRTCGDPRLLVDAPAGTTEITVRFPSWTSVMTEYLARGRPFDYARSCP